MHCSSSALALLFIPHLLTCAAAPISSHNQITLKDSLRSADRVRAALKKADVIPDVLDDFSPAFALTLSYTSAHKTVSLGNEISPSDTSSAPNFEIHSLSSTSTLSPTRTLASNRTYTLVLTDPDATSRDHPVKAQMCHWIVTGISLSASNSSEGMDEASAYTLELSPHARDTMSAEIKHLIGYMAPAPPEGSGKHRYVFVLLTSEDESDGQKGLKKPKERPHWGYAKVGKGVREWADDNSMIAVGANFFYASRKKP
ncbi:hypothetical protein MMC13_005706 [Lambiella insularis]|nr:hypothetical protein [Lambiella insularis]